MTTITKKTSATVRTVRLIREPHTTSPGKFSITETRGRQVETTAYLVTCQDSTGSAGRCFTVEKIGRQVAANGDIEVVVAERYATMIAGDTSTCECKWYVYGRPVNGKPCRHVAAVKRLLELGKIQ